MTWTRCKNHPNAHRHDACSGCHDEKIERFQHDLLAAVMDLMPGAMRVVLGAKVKKVVKLIAEAVR